jgi:hypothetical protein
VNWTMRNNTWKCDGYTIIRGVQGFEAWKRDGERFGILRRGLMTLQDAKDYCTNHSKEPVI